MAILAGDALLSLSFEYIARETRGVDPSRVLRVSITGQEHGYPDSMVDVCLTRALRYYCYLCQTTVPEHLI